MGKQTASGLTALGSTSLPTRPDCIQLLRGFALLSNVERHCIAVATVAYHIGLALMIRKHEVNLDLLFACSLLHDLGKAATIRNLHPHQFGFEPLNADQERRLAILHRLHDALQQLSAEVLEAVPVFGKPPHETDVTRILAGHTFPLLNYHLAHIGGTRDPIYLDAGIEVQISHYADWRLQGTTVVPLAVRLNYLFGRYNPELPVRDRQRRMDSDYNLERMLLEKAGGDLRLDTEPLNTLKSELFQGQYDHFLIDVISDAQGEGDGDTSSGPAPGKTLSTSQEKCPS